MIPTAGSSASGVSTGSAAGFPDPPTGSPGEISAIARSLGQAARELEETERGLTGATEALVADWSGYAANAYRSSSGALAAAGRGATASLRECAEAVSGYGVALETAQTELGRLRGQYEEAKGREAAAAASATSLATHLAAATKSSAIHQLKGDISTANSQAGTAGEEAAGYVHRAAQVLEEFHRAEQRYMQTLAGGATVVGGRSLPAGSPFAAPFAGVGQTGAGFGVPYTTFGGIVPGGLSEYAGVIPVGDPWRSDIPGYGTYLDSREGNASSPSDLTDAITFLAAPVAGKLGEEVLVNGGRALMEEVGIGGAGREAAARAGQEAGLKDFASGNYRTGDPLNTAKMRRVVLARRMGTATMQVGQEEVQNRGIVTALDVLNNAKVLPSGVKELTDAALHFRPYIRVQLERGAQSIIRFFSR